ncbi:uncharacterized protein N7500_007154 [Penicillium coprophilum]|uniref:uncharacterized protein n=1 Tax=Penicillium coprophilum TaxID=36646 RepID=UPI0023A09447|nr:uncharacterized protein N7500_007154 [Penicillium coprophilum]KAJ5165324.1 hypothetical protein N7500_007154 [Penicillium coprophilum]
MAQSSAQKMGCDIKKIQGPTLTIAVGASKEPFHVHKSIICASSPFLEKAMSGPWKESKARTFELPEDDPRIFTLYSHWLYFAKIPEVPKDAASHGKAQKPSRVYHDLVNAYVLGDKLLDIKFQNSVLDAIVEKRYESGARSGTHYLPCYDTINLAYYKTTESAGIRKLFVDMYVRGATGGCLSGNFTKAFLCSVAQGLIKNRAPVYKRIRPFDYYVKPAMEMKNLKRKRSKEKL